MAVTLRPPLHARAPLLQLGCEYAIYGGAYNSIYVYIHIYIYIYIYICIYISISMYRYLYVCINI